MCVCVCVCVCENKPSPVIAYNLKHKDKQNKLKIKMGTFVQCRLAFFADVKRKVLKTHRHTIAAPKVMVIFRQVRACLLYFKAYEFVSCYTQKLQFSS